MKYKTKDSGKREEFKSGMVRDTQSNKPRYDLLLPRGLPTEETMLYRWAMLMERGKTKYGERNWEKANSQEEINRFKASAFRHFIQWIQDETDEDHASAVMFNINATETIKYFCGLKRVYTTPDKPETPKNSISSAVRSGSTKEQNEK